MFKYLQNDVHVEKAGQKGQGVFANRDFNVGEIIISSNLESIVSQRTAYTFEYLENHIIIDKPGNLVNHSCEPNAMLTKNLNYAYDFVACRYIKSGDEITWDYLSIEKEIVGFEECICDAIKCRKNLKLQLLK